MKHCIPFMTRTATALLIVATVLLVVPAQAAENPKLAALKTSLNLVPEDASFYSGMFRAGEQIEVVAKSRAWAKLVNSPAVQMALTMYEMQKENPRSPAAKIDIVLKDPQVQDVLALLADIFDDEAFLYGDASLVESLQFLQRIHQFFIMENLDDSNVRRQNIRKMMKAKTEEEREKAYAKLRESRDAQQKRIFEFFAKNADSIKVPTIVFGAKLDNMDRAKMNLGKLEMLLGAGRMALAMNCPEVNLNGALSRQEIDGGTFVVVKLSGKMIPWEENRSLMRMAQQDPNVAKVIAKIKRENLVIAIGLKGDYLLASIGSSTDAIKNFGHGTGLVTRPEMARLEPYAGQRITDIIYVSKQLAAMNEFDSNDVKSLLNLAAAGMNKGNLDPQAQEEILADLEKLGKQVEKAMPKPGAVASISYMTPTGGEGYTFNWGTGEPAAKPLNLLDHLGGTPILGLVAVCPLNEKNYDAISDWVKVGWGYFEKYGVPKMSKRDQKKFHEAVDTFGPIVAALDKTTREQFLPAFGGEFAIQLDGKLKLTTVPRVEKTMPMLEPAIILSVKDEDLMDDALESYWKTFGDALEAIKTKDKHLADAKLPEPMTVKLDTGKVHIFHLPKKCPVSEDIRPTVGLGKDTLVFALTPEAAERLMKKTPLANPGVLADAKKPRITAGCFVWKDFVETARPWVMLGVDTVLKKSPRGMPLPPSAIRQQAKTVLDVLGVIQSVTFESYRDGDVTVQHNRVELKDLD